MKFFQIAASIMFPLIAVGLFFVQIVFTNNLANEGSILKTVTAKAETLAYDNGQLEQQIASASSLLEVQKKACAMGFIEAKHVMTISQGQHLVALSQKR